MKSVVKDIIAQLPEYDRGEAQCLYITAEAVINKLKDYEVYYEKIYGEEAESVVDNCSYKVGELYETVSGRSLKYLNSDNTYNNSSPVVMQYYVYEDTQTQDVIVLVAFHLGGDVRGNYSEYLALSFCDEDTFSQELFEVDGSTSFTYENNKIHASQNLLSETGLLDIYIQSEDGEELFQDQVYVPVDYEATKDEEAFKKAFLKIIQDNSSPYYSDFAEIREALGIPELEVMLTSDIQNT